MRQQLRVRGQQDFLLNEANFQALVETIPALVWRAKPDGHIDYVNRRLLEYFGSPLEKIIGWGWTDKVHPDDIAVKVQTGAVDLGTRVGGVGFLKAVTGLARTAVSADLIPAVPGPMPLPASGRLPETSKDGSAVYFSGLHQQNVRPRSDAVAPRSIFARRPGYPVSAGRKAAVDTFGGGWTLLRDPLGLERLSQGSRLHGCVNGGCALALVRRRPIADRS
jgi:PAS domain-containing protein